MVKLTKNELKKQKDALKRFKRYLPTLKLKQQQLQSMLQKIQQQIRALREEYRRYYESIQPWIALFGDGNRAAEVQSFIQGAKLVSEEHNVAGVDIPVFKSLECEVAEYNLLATPWWVDDAVAACISVLRMAAEVEVLEKQYALIRRELQITIQRVNLFEKVKIPETRNNIRAIQIYLGDQQTAGVVRGKITKSRIVEESVA